MPENDNQPVTRAELRQELITLEDRMVEQMRSIETTLLTEFRKWALPVNYRLASLETHNERLALIEERLTNLERR